MTASSYENLTPRSVSVVVDPIQSVRGKVVIDAFRTIPRHILMKIGQGMQDPNYNGIT